MHPLPAMHIPFFLLHPFIPTPPQLCFAVIAPGKVVPNLVAGAIAEAGAMQAGDMMQDFKTAYLLNVSPVPQFLGMIIGGVVSVGFSVAFYQLFSSVYDIGAEDSELPAPSAGVWLDMARFVTGSELPTGVLPFGISFFAASAALVLVEMLAESMENGTGLFDSSSSRYFRVDGGDDPTTV